MFDGPALLRQHIRKQKQHGNYLQQLTISSFAQIALMRKATWSSCILLGCEVSLEPVALHAEISINVAIDWGA